MWKYLPTQDVCGLIGWPPACNLRIFTNSAVNLLYHIFINSSVTLLYNVLYIYKFICNIIVPYIHKLSVTLLYMYHAFMPASAAQLAAPSDWRPGGRGFNPRRGQQHSFVEIDNEIFCTVILSLPLIQDRQLSVSGKRMCTILVNRLESFWRKNVHNTG